MKKRNKRNQAPNPRKVSASPDSPKKRRLWCIGICLAGVALVIVAWVVLRSSSAKGNASPAYVPRPPGTVTFAKNVAPILFQHCAPCHRPGQSAPFSLLNYEAVLKKAKLIGEVTERRYMPPWLPEHGYGNFAGERWLSVDEIGLGLQLARRLPVCRAGLPPQGNHAGHAFHLRQLGGQRSQP